MGRAIARGTFLKLAGGTAAATWLPRRASAQGPIRIGFTLSATGPYAVGAGITQRPNYDLWLDQVNAKGGLAVAGGGRRPWGAGWRRSTPAGHLCRIRAA